MTTYNVDAKLLEGIILKLKPHSQRELLLFCHTLNIAYGLSLYDVDINFILKDVCTNGLTKIL